LSQTSENSLTRWILLAEICQAYGKQQCHLDMACPKSATQSLLNIVTSLIGPYEMFSSAMFGVLAANNLGFGLMALAEIWQTFGCGSVTRTWHDPNQPHRAFSTL
jgi:hypothetical protein